MHRLTRDQARRIAVRAQLLDAPRPADVLDVVRHLSVLQHDGTAYVAPNAHLVLWSRLGSAYSPDDLDSLLEDRSLVELRGMIRPAEDIALFRAEMAAWPGPEPRRPWQDEIAAWVGANALAREEILQTLRSEGPQPARGLPDSTAVPWRSSGWTNAKNVQRLLDFLEARGEVAVSHREGRERIWDLAERVYPDDTVLPLEEARRERDRRRLSSLGIARAKSPEQPGEPLDVGDAGEPAVVDGVRGAWRVDPAYLDGGFTGRAALLSPLDRLVMDRKRLTEIFEYDYQLEMYKPQAVRRWGYFALPVLWGDRLVGKLDAEADRAGGVLRVHALHEDAPLPRAAREAVDAEIRGLAGWLRLEIERE